MIDAKTSDEIRALYQKIHTLYQEARQRPSGMVCDICGTGDIVGKNSVAYKVRQPVHGYENRREQSPRLCHRHASGWAHSHNAYNNGVNQRTAEQVDLHFAAYLAKQLMKGSRHE